MMEGMQTPKTRAEFEHRFHLLKEQMSQGKIHFGTGAILGAHGIEKVRLLPNGRIDFLSVNESARCLVNTSAHFQNHPLIEMTKNLETRDSKNSTTDI